MEDSTLTSRDYYQALGEGDITNHAAWSKIGYTPTMNTSESEIWSSTGAYVFPTAAAGMEVVSSSANDTGTSIFSGTSSDGSTTQLVDATKDFTAGTPVAVGDCIVLDKSGTTPEWGYVSAVTNATTLAVSGGFSSGGTGSGRAYTILDYSATTGAQAVKIAYLTSAFAEKEEILLLNGTNVVATTNLDLYRVNSFRIIAAGSGLKAAGNIAIRNLADTPNYSYITAGYTRARNVQYTVPASKQLFVNEINAGFGLSGNQKVEYCRMYTKANREPSTRFLTGNIFYSYTEMLLGNGMISIRLPIPTRLDAGTDIKVSGISSAAGVAAVALRGWLETV
jgi:hypothetical protein